MMGIEWLKPGVFFGSLVFALMGVAIFLTLPLCAVLRPTVSTEPVKI